MLLLQPEAGEKSGLGGVLLFGVGLLGGALADELERRGWAARLHPFTWDDPGLRQRELERIRREGERLVDAHPRLAVVWAAGRAGFGSDEAEIGGELRSCREVLGLAGDLAARSSGAVDVHVLSSIGGLFEGQRHVTAKSRPAPRRPYGRLKLLQEEALARTAGLAGRQIHRLASVFGAPVPGVRRGLIPTLLANTERHRETRIVGRLDTLRDFVWNRDVGRYLADRLERPPLPGATVSSVASGKPSSIHEILGLVEEIVGKRPLIRFDPAAGNSLDITVAAEALADGWRPTGLNGAICQLRCSG